MGRVPDFKRIAKEDFPQEDHALIEKLAFPLNSHMEQVRNALNKSINFDNLAQELIPLRVQTGGNSKPLNTLTFKSNLLNKVQGILVVSASVVSNNLAYPEQAPFISPPHHGGCYQAPFG